ncbi:hypothetical protein GCM10010470_23500 [Saccharopolyspora taberi]|uniref:HEAT repeat domain-containing protein n=1 Tax=Saccharopolyspora taberi TaxID=60895 RepID=A0ABN3VB45_9PSEU
MDLTQLLTLGAVLVTLALAVPSYITAQSQAHLAEQGQLTDRFSKAVEQLGSDKPQIRQGGIYALERLARDSQRDHPVVVEVSW